MTARALRALHVPGDPLVLPNVWDADSARIVAEAGFPVVATGSAAVAAVLGYGDGEQTPPEEMFGAIARISGVVDVPVTADVERGYGLTPAELVARLAESGAVGCNLEDSDPRTESMFHPEEQADFLAAVRAADPELVINARVDTFLYGTGTRDERLAEAVRRGRRYLEAGADRVYPIRIPSAAIATVVAEAGGPVNVLAKPGMPALTDLAALGVARISYGHGLHQRVQALTRDLVAAVRAGRDPFVRF